MPWAVLRQLPVRMDRSRQDPVQLPVSRNLRRVSGLQQAYGWDGYSRVNRHTLNGVERPSGRIGINQYYLYHQYKVENMAFFG